MAGSAVIGALRVDLSLNAGEFSKGARNAERQMAQFGTTIGRMATGVGAALAGAFSVQTITNILASADAMGKAAQAAGVPIKKFSELAFAAELVGMNTQELSATLGQFNRAMAEAVRPGTDAALVFELLGVSVKDNNGRMRDAASVLADVADKFSLHADDANKARIAQELFGQSGAKMIPLLNEGRQGLQDAADEAARLGVVLDKAAAAKAKAFNESMIKLGAAARGVGQELGFLVSGPLTSFLNTITEIIATARSGSSGSFVKDLILDQASGAEIREQLTLVTEQLAVMVRRKEALANTPWTRPQALKALDDQIEATSAKIDAMVSKLRATSVAGAGAQAGPQTGPQTGAWQTSSTSFSNFDDAKLQREKEIRESQALSVEQMRIYTEQADLLSQTLMLQASPYQELIAQNLELQRVQAMGVLSSEQIAKASERTAATMRAVYASAASNVTGALATIFNKSKAFSLANAIVSTYEAANRALALPPAPNYAAMAAALATGFANVRSIMSASPGSGGGGRSAAPAGGGSGAGGGAPAQQAAPSRSLYIANVSPSQMYSGEAVRHLLSAINEQVKDGGILISSGVRA